MDWELELKGYVFGSPPREVHDNLPAIISFEPGSEPTRGAFSLEGVNDRAQGSKFATTKKKRYRFRAIARLP